MTVTRAGSLEVAKQLFAAIEAGRVDIVRDLYATDAVIWHSHDDVQQTRDENLALLSWVVTNLGDVRYEQIRRSATDSGFVQQHVLRATNRAGVRIEIPACMVCAVSDGRITRVDEYLDSRHVALVTAR
jgi:ketosteroid isomerase-like protein